MSYLNSTNPYWIYGASIKSASKASRIEVLPMGYMVVQAWRNCWMGGDAKLVPRNKPKIPAAYAMSAELLGMRPLKQVPSR